MSFVYDPYSSSESQHSPCFMSSCYTPRTLDCTPRLSPFGCQPESSLYYLPTNTQQILRLHGSPPLCCANDNVVCKAGVRWSSVLRPHCRVPAESPTERNPRKRQEPKEPLKHTHTTPYRLCYLPSHQSSEASCPNIQQQEVASLSWTLVVAEDTSFLPEPGFQPAALCPCPCCK